MGMSVWLCVGGTLVLAGRGLAVPPLLGCRRPARSSAASEDTSADLWAPKPLGTEGALFSFMCLNCIWLMDFDIFDS